MNPYVTQRIARSKGEGYSLVFSVDLGDPEADASGVTEPRLAIGSVIVAGSTTDTEAVGVVDLTFPIAPLTLNELDYGTYLMEVSLKLGGDAAVVAGGTFALSSSRTLEVST